MKASNRRMAFTLIEVLIVIAVITIIAAILMPVFAQAREKARQASCSSNMHQLSRAFQMYLGDYDGQYPDGGNFTRRSPAAWVRCEREFEIDVGRGVLFPYVRSREVYRCPSDPNAPARRLSYSMNELLQWLAESQISFPAATVLLIDEDARSGYGKGVNDGAFDPRGVVDALTRRHAGGGIVAWTDGHAGFLPATRLARDRPFEPPRIFQPVRDRE